MGLCCYSICGYLCFNSSQSKTLEIVLIVMNSISFILLLLSLIMIKWNEISKANLAIFIIMLLINIIYLIFPIFLRYWRARNLIKEAKRSMANALAIAGLTLTIIQFILCIIEEILLTYGFNEANYPCHKNDKHYYYRRISTEVNCAYLSSDYNAEVITVTQFMIAYITFSYLEIALILGNIIWYILRRRIQQQLDGPAAVQISPNVVDPYGRAVVVVQPGDIVMMGGNPYQYNPYIQNPSNIPAPSAQYPGSHDFQIQEKYPGSNDFQIQEKIS